jgi:erythromycin esterase-like protein
MQEVLKYLDKVDPAAAGRARQRYACFEQAHEDPQAYGYAASYDLDRSCEDEVVRQLSDILAHAADYAQRDGRAAEDEYFFTEQNARLVRNAEHYYRTMFAGRVSSWNLRDQHMVETVGALARRLDRFMPQSKMILWAHNSHLGDARATEMGEGGEWNVGQLMRQRWPGEVFNIGFTTHAGSVTCATDWDGPAEVKRVRPSLPGSYERLFHEVGIGQFHLLLSDGNPAARLLPRRLLERAIGVIYRPETERLSHYFHAQLAEQFDAVIHYDHSRAVEPLERSVRWQPGDVPETYPTNF